MLMDFCQNAENTIFGVYSQKITVKSIANSPKSIYLLYLFPIAIVFMQN